MKKLSLVFAIGILTGAILWNGWVLGWLNHGLAGYLHMSISELEAIGQPQRTVFDLLENVSGLLMVIGGLGALVAHKKTLILSVILLGISLIGALTIYDVAHPLDCSRYQDPACVAKIDAQQLSHTNMLHETESRITAYVTGFLVLLVVLWAYAEKLSPAVLRGLGVVAGGTIITLIILDTSSNVLVGAVSERLWNLLVSVDIGFVAFRLLGQDRRLTAIIHR